MCVTLVKLRHIYIYIYTHTNTHTSLYARTLHVFKGSSIFLFPTSLYARTLRVFKGSSIFSFPKKIFFIYTNLGLLHCSITKILRGVMRRSMENLFHSQIHTSHHTPRNFHNWIMQQSQISIYELFFMKKKKKRSLCACAMRVLRG